MRLSIQINRHHKFFYKNHRIVNFSSIFNVIDDYAKSLELIKSVCSTYIPSSSSSNDHLENEEDGFDAMGTHESDYHEIDQSSLLLQGMVNIQAKEMVRSIGALLIFLMTYIRKDHFDHDQPSISIHSFIPLDLTNYMSIDRVRLKSIHA